MFADDAECSESPAKVGLKQAGLAKRVVTDSQRIGLRIADNYVIQQRDFDDLCGFPKCTGYANVGLAWSGVTGGMVTAVPMFAFSFRAFPENQCASSNAKLDLPEP